MQRSGRDGNHSIHRVIFFVGSKPNPKIRNEKEKSHELVKLLKYSLKSYL